MLHKSFESFSNALNEGKVTYKRKYTENHPAKKMYSSSKVRTKVLEAIGERKISKMAFERILRELNANPRYGYRNRKLFKIEEDSVSLSPQGMKMYKAAKLNEGVRGYGVGDDLKDFDGMDFMSAQEVLYDDDDFTDAADSDDWKLMMKIVSKPKYKQKLRKYLIHSKKDMENFAKWLSSGMHFKSESKNSIDEEYQGWSNWDTWNANLHLTNDEGIYKMAMKARNKKALKDLFIQMFGNGADGINVNRVDFQEIHDGLNESQDPMINEGAFKTLMMMFEEGASDREIAKEFPQLDAKDIKAMRVQFENTMELVGEYGEGGFSPDVDDEEELDEALNGFQKKVLLDAVVRQAKPGQALTVANLRATKMSDGRWFFHGRAGSFRGAQDIETTIEVFSEYAFAELDGEYLRDLDVKFTGSGKNTKIKSLKLESNGLEEKLDSREKSEVLSALGRFVFETGKKDADVDEVVDFIVDETKHRTNDVLEFILALNQGSNLIVFEGAPIITEASQLITEGTRSQIGMILPNGKVRAAYCHYDGYPDHNGDMLKKHYTNPKKVKELMSLAHAGISFLDKSISGGPNHSFADPQKGETIFYGRDRGESHDMITIYRNEEDYLNNADQEYAYLYDPKKKQWSYCDVYAKNKKWIVLESNINIPEVVIPINEKKARYKGMLKVAKTMLKLFQQDLIFSPTNKNFTQAGKNNLYLTLYILLEALTDANFHRERAALEKPLKKYMRFENMMIAPETSTGLTYKTAQALGISLALKKSHAQAYGDNVYSKIANAGDWSGPAIAYGVCMYLENYGDTAAGAIAASTLIKDAFKEEFPLPKELL